MQHRSIWVGLAASLGVLTIAACGSKAGSGFDPGPSEGVLPDGSSPGTGNGSSVAYDGGGFVTDGSSTSGPVQTCDEAAAARSYIGCDYWPTVTANAVWSIFDFAVVVANANPFDVDVTVTGPNGTNEKVKVSAGQLQKIFLPWVPSLKGPDADECGSSTKKLTASVVAKKGAFHLVSSAPVTVYQFSALEYQGKGGPAGKDWSSCPGNDICLMSFGPIGCFAYSNDASLLLPSSAMTGNYRVAGLAGQSDPLLGRPIVGPNVTITATQDQTKVTVKVGKKGSVLAGSGIPKTTANGLIDLTLDAGDVVEIVGESGNESDLSGSQVAADKPVQVIASSPCQTVPLGKAACDHIEETVFPAETLGKRYVVAAPSGPAGKVVGQAVRLYGSVDGTTLKYSPRKPASCPDRIGAGDVGDCGIVEESFQVEGDHEFAVGTYLLGAELVGGDQEPQKGDPSATFVSATEQYRTRYVFLAPDDYDLGFVDLVIPEETEVMLDGVKVNQTPTAISEGFGVLRLALSKGTAGGAHELVSTKPVGAQVIGYGAYTSYQYPGGLDLKSIAPPPPPPR